MGIFGLKIFYLQQKTVAFAAVFFHFHTQKQKDRNNHATVLSNLNKNKNTVFLLDTFGTTGQINPT